MTDEAATRVIHVSHEEQAPSLVPSQEYSLNNLELTYRIITGWISNTYKTTDVRLNLFYIACPHCSHLAHSLMKASIEDPRPELVNTTKPSQAKKRC